MIRLLELRKAKGFTQDALAEKANVPQSVISAIEVGRAKNPTIGIMQKLAKALGVPLEEMLDENDVVENSTA